MLTIVAGLLLRLAPLGLPFVITKWGGTLLWAAMVYLLIAMLIPHSRTVTVAALAAAVATLVELLRLYHAPWLDSFRLTLAGTLLLGRVFQYWHFVAYSVTILCVAGLDRALIRVRAEQRS
jgi:hypothetical protein